MNNWKDVMIVPEFDEQGVACYKLEGGDYLNEYYIVSEDGGINIYYVEVSNGIAY